MTQYDFDTLADRSIDNARKWDSGIVHSKFPKVRDDFIPLWIADMDFQAAPEIARHWLRCRRTVHMGIHTLLTVGTRV